MQAKRTGDPATRYVNPQTRASVVIDDKTGEVIHVGEPDFIHGVESGDVPGAKMRPPPTTDPPTVTPIEPESPVVEEPIIPPEIIFPP
jgi:hypothetical protein